MSTSEQDLWVESGRGQMPFKERQCREKTVSLWLKRTKPFFTVTKNQDFGLFPKGIGNFHSKWYIACFYISIHWISGLKLWGFPSGISNLHSIPSLHWRFVLFTRVGNWHSSPKSCHSLQKNDPVKLLVNNFFDNLWNKQSGATIWNMGSSLCMWKYQTTHRN